MNYLQNTARIDIKNGQVFERILRCEYISSRTELAQNSKLAYP